MFSFLRKKVKAVIVFIFTLLVGISLFVIYQNIDIFSISGVSKTYVYLQKGVIQNYVIYYLIF